MDHPSLIRSQHIRQGHCLLPILEINATANSVPEAKELDKEVEMIESDDNRMNMTKFASGRFWSGDKTSLVLSESAEDKTCCDVVVQRLGQYPRGRQV